MFWGPDVARNIPKRAKSIRIKPSLNMIIEYSAFLKDPSQVIRATQKS